LKFWNAKVIGKALSEKTKFTTTYTIVYALS